MLRDDGTEKITSPPGADGSPSFFASPQWLEELLKPLEATPVVYALVVSGILLALLWVIHLFFRFLVLRPLAGSQIFKITRWIPVGDLVKIELEWRGLLVFLNLVSEVGLVGGFT